MFVPRHSRWPRRKIALCLADALFTAAAMYLAVILRLGLDVGMHYLQIHTSSVIATWSIFIISFYIGGLYESNRLQRIGGTLTAAAIAVTLGALISLAVFYATSSEVII